MFGVSERLSRSISLAVHCHDILIRVPLRLACSIEANSGDVMTRVSVRLSRRSLAFPGFTYSSLREYKRAV